MFELTDKTALVTGATGGIGGGVARALHKQGATVAISGRQVDKLEKLAAELGSRVHVCPCDLANKAQVAKLVDDATAKLGRLDILVNNAGLTKDNLFMVMKDDQWDDVIAVNLTSTFMLMRAATRGMMRAKSGYGRIINITSISGVLVDLVEYIDPNECTHDPCGAHVVPPYIPDDGSDDNRCCHPDCPGSE